MDSQEEIRREGKGEIVTVRSSLVLIVGTVGSSYSTVAGGDVRVTAASLILPWHLDNTLSGIPNTFRITIS
jgi:hypothetical protein